MSTKWRRFEVMLPRQFNDGRDVPAEWISLAALEIGDELGIIPELEFWGPSKALSRLSEAMMIAPLLLTLNQFSALGLLGRPRMSPIQAA